MALHLVFAGWINNAKEIVGQGRRQEQRRTSAFLDHAATSSAISPRLRNLLQQRLQDGRLVILQIPFPLGGVGNLGQ
jgi:hypothetical protein